jgi:hypothetical protein
MGVSEGSNVHGILWEMTKQTIFFHPCGALGFLLSSYPTLAPHKAKARGSDGAKIVAALRAYSWKCTGLQIDKPDSRNRRLSRRSEAKPR